MAGVHFLSELTPFKFPDTGKTANWLKQVCRHENRVLGSLTYVFCSDSYLKALNKQCLNHNVLTDILSFDYSESDEIQGEIYISIPRVRENAKKYKQIFASELRRVIVHGLLHLIGFNDKTPSQKAQMQGKEEACLSLWK